ncbi:hypothetical protein C7H19_13285 [Aphanothece hegewaldii CCALA 016]|uniref:Putative zinc-finger domain-containing protein n=1 Tax=Aphanothece hegewaldii CCALA 016 TaxID=2107694 RepID=A0A2T1LWX7_9CHRO|nr:zf-HC2 domain-containing protein [Aphanothece hegewaldii]PSF36646.1 hypothetical protein C7H19_13285 [Aphanothece hegewaldii CCALA 016]
MKDFESLNDLLFSNLADSHSIRKTLKDISHKALFDTASMDRFELLSAYLDGEVTADERRQVQQWLDTDPQVQQWYRQLTQLQHSAKYCPTPTHSQPVEHLSEQVFQKLERRRNKRLFLIGGALVTAIAVGFGIHFSFGKYSLRHQMANTLPSMSETEEPLMIALNHPLYDLSVTNEKQRHHK